ncbi:MAG: hypothetical protein Ta2D_02410 [Rickettsiales bacterium]|nr:MAG: hypothetical protein Ta2D_02410 [Rickettsiales bacterium]
MKKIFILVSLVLVSACSFNTTRFSTIKQYSNVKQAREFELKFFEGEGIKAKDVNDNVVVYERSSPNTTFLYAVSFINPLNFADYYCVYFNGGEQKYGKMTLYRPFNLTREYASECNSLFVAEVQNNGNKKEVVAKKVEEKKPAEKKVEEKKVEEKPAKVETKKPAKTKK